MSPGEVVQQMQKKCQLMLENNERMAVESNKRWYDKVANPPTEWLELKTSSPSYTQRHAGCNKLQLWTLISKRPMVSLNANTGEATVYEPNLRHLPIIRKDLDQLSDELLGKYNKPPGYVLYNNINHYNAIIRTESEDAEDMEHTPMQNTAKRIKHSHDETGNEKVETEHKKRKRNTCIISDSDDDNDEITEIRTGLTNEHKEEQEYSTSAGTGAPTQIDAKRIKHSHNKTENKDVEIEYKKRKRNAYIISDSEDDNDEITETSVGLTAEHKEEQGYSSAGTGAGHMIYAISDSEDDNDAITATNTCTKDNTGTGAGVIESQTCNGESIFYIEQ
jgi:hypothetical protein